MAAERKEPIIKCENVSFTVDFCTHDEMNKKTDEYKNDVRTHDLYFLVMHEIVSFLTHVIIFRDNDNMQKCVLSMLIYVDDENATSVNFKFNFNQRYYSSARKDGYREAILKMVRSNYNSIVNQIREKFNFVNFIVNTMQNNYAANLEIGQLYEVESNKNAYFSLYKNDNTIKTVTIIGTKKTDDPQTKTIVEGAYQIICMQYERDSAFSIQFNNRIDMRANGTKGARTIANDCVGDHATLRFSIRTKPKGNY